MVSWIRAERHEAVASWTCRLRSAEAPVARTSPRLTASPTLAVTSLTVQVAVPASPVAAPERCAVVPNARPYVSAAATLPVAATSSVTSPVVAALVR